MKPVQLNFIFTGCNKLDCFALSESFHTSLILAAKGRTQQKVLQANIRLRWKCPSVTNTLAYLVPKTRAIFAKLYIFHNWQMDLIS